MVQPDPLDLHTVLYALQHKIEESGNENFEKVGALQQEILSLGNTQERLETQVYHHEHTTTVYQKEISQLTKSKKDIEKKLAAELESFETERLRWQQCEADYDQQIKKWMPQQLEPRNHKRKSMATALDTSPTPLTFMSTHITPTTTQPMSYLSIYPLETSNEPIREGVSSEESTGGKEEQEKAVERTVQTQEKLIADLKRQGEKVQSAMEEQDLQVQAQLLRIEHLEQMIISMKQLNRSLMEENESYQILLHERTLNGEFNMDSILQVNDGENFQDKLCGLHPSSSTTSNNSLNLAEELTMATENTSQVDKQASEELRKSNQRLTEEVKILTDTNRALQLYMNKILMRIISNKQLESALSIDQPRTAPCTLKKAPMPLLPFNCNESVPKQSFSSHSLNKATHGTPRSFTTPSLPGLPGQRHSAQAASLSAPRRSSWSNALRRMSGSWTSPDLKTLRD
ncbi:hypothetical protein BDF14DRAFT_1744091 [Spinellus fusiger]|nr:hypothetical protein BDF14DRAFT_1744091 [Spinellus fusiger]